MYILNNFSRNEGDNISSNVIFHKTLGWVIVSRKNRSVIRRGI